jgi:hypothetical protein
MRTLKLTAAGVLLVVFGASAVSAQVQLSIRNGRVTLSATNATVRQILAEWARVGQTKIVNVERIPGGPLTLQFANIPEQEALDILLRSVTGYMAAQRSVPVATLSRYDRILVLPTAAAARVPVSGPATTAAQRPVPQPEDDSDEQPSVVQAPRGPLFPTFQLSQPPNQQQGGASATPGGFPQQPVVQNPTGEGNNNSQPVLVTPFGAAGGPVGTPRPGMVVQPPATPGAGGQPGQPVPAPEQ